MSYTALRYSTVEDWARLRPVLGLYKIALRRVIGRAYMFKAAPDRAALRDVCHALGNRPLAVTIAFNTVWMLKWQLRFGQLHLHGADRLLADNSSDPKASAEIELLCREAGAHYLKLPFNRFSLGRPKDASLSHAAALNWVWRHVVLPTRPPIIAILDHDLIPLRKVDFSSKIEDQPFYGIKMPGARFGWQVWPGYAVFDGSLIDRYRFDFSAGVRAGLDTGGANWNQLYRHFDDTKLRFANPSGDVIGRFEEWWHVGNASEYAPTPPGWRKHVEEEARREYEKVRC
jgi:hypothetical protein